MEDLPMTETIDEVALNDLIGKVIGDVAGAMSLFMAYLGDQAGVFSALDGAGRVTSNELAAKLRLNPKIPSRMARFGLCGRLSQTPCR